MLVHLRGICEATAARDQIRVEVPAPVTATAVAGAVCETLGSQRLRTALFHNDGRLRATTRILDTTGRPLAGSASVTGPAVKLAAVLPCDG
jgi:hypothetical protein